MSSRCFLICMSMCSQVGLQCEVFFVCLFFSSPSIILSPSKSLASKQEISTPQGSLHLWGIFRVGLKCELFKSQPRLSHSLMPDQQPALPKNHTTSCVTIIIRFHDRVLQVQEFATFPTHSPFPLLVSQILPHHYSSRVLQQKWHQDTRVSNFVYTYNAMMHIVA